MSKTNSIIDENKYLKLSLIYKNEVKSAVFIGINRNSNQGFDKYDYFAAPGDFENFKISLVNNNLPLRYRNLFIEHRPDIGEGQEFNLTIKLLPNQQTNLNVEGFDNFNEFEVYLFDNRINKLYNLKEKRELELVSTHKFYEMKLLIGNDKFIKDKIKELQPLDYCLFQNYPNPFNPGTFIRFSLPEKNRVILSIYSILGQLVKTIIDNQEYEPGNYEVELNSNNLASGVYFYKFQTNNFTKIKKMILLK